MQDLVIIAHRDQLRLIANIRPPRRVALRFLEFTESDGILWEEKLNSAISACGCGEAAVFLFVAIAVVSALAYFNSPISPRGIFATTSLGLVLGIVSVGIGKSYGRKRARYRLQAMVNQLRTMLKDGPGQLRTDENLRSMSGTSR
jgi:hypothetical protein